MVLYVGCFAYLRVCASVGFVVVRYQNTIPKANRSALTWMGSAPYLERHFTWYLYIKYPLIQPNLLWSFKKSRAVPLKNRVKKEISVKKQISSRGHAEIRNINGGAGAQPGGGS